MYQLILARAGVISPWIEPGKQVGDAIWVREREHARHLIEAGIADWPKTAPSEIQEDAAPAERKSFAARTVGQLTDSRSLTASGLVPPLRV
jgi:hypothetical protein